MKAIVSETAKVCPQFYDLDPMNIVWHGNYPRFFELARTALLGRIGYGYEAMVASGYAWPVIDMHVRYYRPLKLGRWIDATASIVEWENRLKIDYLLRDAETLVEGVVADSDRAEQQVAVAADVFGDGLHGDVDAMSEGVEEHAGGPGVVDHNFYVARVSGGDNGWDVLNLHGD